MSNLSLGNCGACWDNPCTCGKQSYSDSSLGLLRTDELLALKAKIEAIVTSRNQSVSYAAHTTGGLVKNPLQTTALQIASDPFFNQGNSCRANFQN